MSKTILITGATGNLGYAVSEYFLKQDYRVIGTIRPGKDSPDDGVDYYECDLTSLKSTEDLFEKLSKKYDQLDAAICLVGGFGMGTIEEATSDDMMKMLSLNYMTAFHTSQKAFSWMKQTGGGSIIFVGAKPAIEGGASSVLPYAIAKNAVVKLAEILNESGKDHHIKAPVIVPSVIDTPPNRESMPDADFSDWVTPEQIAESIGFLISEKSFVLRKTILKIYNNA